MGGASAADPDLAKIGEQAEQRGVGGDQGAAALGGYAYAGDNPVTNSDPSGKNMMIDTGSCVGSIQFCVAHTPSSGGGSSSRGGNSGGGGICYYCHYAPPRYTSGASYYTPLTYYAPSAYYSPSATSTSGWFPPEAPGFNSPRKASPARSSATPRRQIAASSGTPPSLFLAYCAPRRSCSVWQLAGSTGIILGGLGELIHILTGGHHPPLPDPGGLGTRPVVRPEHPQGQPGDEGIGAPPGDEPGGGIIIRGGPGGWWPEGEPIGPPIHIDPPEQPPAEEPTGEENSSVIDPPFLPGVIGDFGLGSGIETGWLPWGW